MEYIDLTIFTFLASVFIDNHLLCLTVTVTVWSSWVKCFLKIFYFNVVATVKVGNAVSLTGDTTHTGVFD